MRIQKFLLGATLIFFSGTVLTSIPLIVNYINGTDPRFPFIVDLHVWFGAIFMVIVLSRICINRKRLKNMLLNG